MYGTAVVEGVSDTGVAVLPLQVFRIQKLMTQKYRVVLSGRCNVVVTFGCVIGSVWRVSGRCVDVFIPVEMACDFPQHCLGYGAKCHSDVIRLYCRRFPIAGTIGTKFLARQTSLLRII